MGNRDSGPDASDYFTDVTIRSFQQYAIASAKHVAHIPDGVPLDEVAPVLCAGMDEASIFSTVPKLT